MAKKAKTGGAKKSSAKPAAGETTKAKSAIAVLRRSHDRSAKFLEHLARDVLKLSPSQYYRIEKNPRRGTAKQLELIAKTFGVQVGDLLADGGSLGTQPLPRMHPPLPILEMSELGSRGIPSENDREFITPWARASKDAYGLKIRDDMNSPVLAEGDIAIVEPRATDYSNSTVVAEVEATGEILIGKYLPLPPRHADAPGFILQPHNRSFEPITCGHAKPAKLLGKIIEKRVVFA